MPWTTWNVGDVSVKTEVCQVERDSPAGKVQVVGSLVTFDNRSNSPKQLTLFAAVRALGPAGGRIKEIQVGPGGRSIVVDGHPALVTRHRVAAAGVAAADTVGDFASRGDVPRGSSATSEAGDASGVIRLDITLNPRQYAPYEFVCPVLPGRRAVGHKWDRKDPWAQLDDAVPFSADGILQPNPGLDYYSTLSVDDLFTEARQYWKDLVGRTAVRVPDRRWGQALTAITGHLAMCMNDDAPDVAVVNYNVFNRDGMYTANVFQKSGRPDLAEKAIDYFLAHPFNGRIYPEADNPGQILWIIGEHWLFTRDKAWLRRVYPSMKQIVEMVRYYRTTPAPHWVTLDGLTFGDAAPKEIRKELKPGRCDGYHPEYTEAYDIAGLRHAAMLARAIGNDTEADDWSRLAESLFATYEKRFGDRLPKEYGSYSVLWPCRLYPFQQGKAYEQFKQIGVQRPASWRYFPLATAHQGLLTGNRAAGHATLDEHLKHEQMRGWYAFDEGGKSGAGGWRHVNTTWNKDVAMPHGWAIAEVHLLLRDSLLFEDAERLVLFAGVPESWFTAKEGMELIGIPTHFGPIAVKYQVGEATAASLTFDGNIRARDGIVLRFPKALRATFTADGAPLEHLDSGDVVIPSATKRVDIRFE